ncbi:MAG: YjbH domain-containing protein [Ignavibacteria bacterium]|nr:YjbH domain-containing protein [Ignavibacteria bacterium]MBI3766022.1 YjbH domain-containing protein [Ignavibacteriales bacterium]
MTCSSERVKILLLCVLLNTMCCIQYSAAQGSVGSDAAIEPRYLIDLPTAGIIPHGNLALDMDFYQLGGLLVCTSIGAFDRLLLGVSYGGTKIIGRDKPTWNSTPGFSVKLRVIEETIFLPAIAVGFDSQGKEAYLDELNRYTIKSVGFYVVASKNYRALGFLSLHGGVNYSLERADNDSDPNLFAGVEKTLGPILSVMAEYNLGANDSDHNARGKGRGYFNAGVRMSVGNGLSLGLNLKDLLKNQQDVSVGSRTVVLEYVRSL